MGKGAETMMGLFSDIQSRGLWESYSRYVVALEPILEATSKRGTPISPEQHAASSAQLTAQMDSLFKQMQALVPDDVKILKEYKRKPPVRLSFKPSKPALVRYMKFRSHRVLKDWKTDKDTTKQDELARLYRETKDELYRIVREYRDAQTVLKNHLKNWSPCIYGDPRCSLGMVGCKGGRVHPTFYHTATGQLEARRPNTMNAPHHKAEQMEIFRSIVQAPLGHTLFECDYKGFHALYLAWESGDEVMARVARIDLPSFATAHFLKLPHADEAISWPDDQLRDWLATVKQDYRAVRDAKMKHALHGYDNGMRARGCYLRYRDYFESEREVRRMLSMLDSLFGAAYRFRQEKVEQAHERGYLISKFGCIRYFWEAKKWRGGEWSHGDDAEAAISFIQQNHAHCHLKDVMLRLDARGCLERFGFCTSEHDKLIFCCSDHMLHDAIDIVDSEMLSPNEVTGLSIGVETKIGQSWNRMVVYGK